jgi:uncharacterized protein YgiM (DUF1202 family)
MSLETGLEGGNYMANHNYSQYSNNKKNGGNAGVAANAAKTENKKNPTTEVEVPVETTASEVKMVVEPAETVKPELVSETVETKEVSKTVTGTVVNCTKLNVRTKPSLTADVVTVIDAGEKVTIDVAESNRDWFRVKLDGGNQGYNGYCMKKFVAAKL